MIKIAVVNSSSFGKVFPGHWRVLNRLGKVKRFDVPVDIDGKKLGRMVRGCQSIIAGVNPTYTKTFFQAAGSALRLITRHGIGYNNVDIQAASEAGVFVAKVQGLVEQEAMAEHVFALLFSALRKLDGARSAVRKGRWLDRPAFVGTEIKGKVLGVVGIGNIGRRVAEIGKKGFGARVIAYDPRLKPRVIRRRGAEPVPFKHLLKTADLISLNCSLSKVNYHFINGAALKLVKRGLVLVNTARGELVEEKALIRALRSGRLAAYACDVVEGEPITHPRHPLLRQANAIVVPHIGAYTKESLWAMGEKVVRDVRAVAQGKRPGEVVNPGFKSPEK